MAYDWSIDHDTRTVRVRGHGEGTSADMLGLIERLRDEIRDVASYDVVYNSLDLRIQPTPSDMMKVAQALFGDAGARFRRFAIVVPPARIPLARIFVALAHPFGVTANVFRDEENAREWLSERRQWGHIEARPATDPLPADPRHPPPVFPHWPEPTDTRHAPPSFPPSPPPDPEP